jgi:hypothetical protein
VATVVVNSGSRTPQPLVAVAASVTPAAPVSAGTTPGLVLLSPPALRLRGLPRGRPRGPGTDARGGAAEGGVRAPKAATPVDGGPASEGLAVCGVMATRRRRYVSQERPSRVHGDWDLQIWQSALRGDHSLLTRPRHMSHGRLASQLLANTSPAVSSPLASFDSHAVHRRNSPSAPSTTTPSCLLPKVATASLMAAWRDA